MRMVACRVVFAVLMGAQTTALLPASVGSTQGQPSQIANLTSSKRLMWSAQHNAMPRSVSTHRSFMYVHSIAHNIQRYSVLNLHTIEPRTTTIAGLQTDLIRNVAVRANMFRFRSPWL